MLAARRGLGVAERGALRGGTRQRLAGSHRSGSPWGPGLCGTPSRGGHGARTDGGWPGGNHGAPTGRLLGDEGPLPGHRVGHEQFGRREGKEQRQVPATGPPRPLALPLARKRAQGPAQSPGTVGQHARASGSASGLARRSTDRLSPAGNRTSPSLPSRDTCVFPILGRMILSGSPGVTARLTEAHGCTEKPRPGHQDGPRPAAAEEWPPWPLSWGELGLGVWDPCHLTWPLGLRRREPSSSQCLVPAPGHALGTQLLSQAGLEICPPAPIPRLPGRTSSHRGTAGVGTEVESGCHVPWSGSAEGARAGATHGGHACHAEPGARPSGKRAASRQPLTRDPRLY